MARRAVKHTYAYEAVSPDSRVRRLVRAGQLVPDTWDDFEDPEAIVDDTYQDRAVVTAHAYVHNQKVPVEIQNEQVRGRKGAPRNETPAPAAAPPTAVASGGGSQPAVDQQ